jgi:hypothetical protein
MPIQMIHQSCQQVQVLSVAVPVHHHFHRHHHQMMIHLEVGGGKGVIVPVDKRTVVLEGGVRHPLPRNIRAHAQPLRHPPIHRVLLLDLNPGLILVVEIISRVGQMKTGILKMKEGEEDPIPEIGLESVINRDTLLR